MLQLAPRTVHYLFDAQSARLKGRLRLDISSHQYPADPRKTLDVLGAQVALAERLLRLLGDLAEEAVVDDPHTSEVIVMPSPAKFEAIVEQGLIDDFGLNMDHPQFHQALACLAADFHAWTTREPLQAKDDYGIEYLAPRTIILCEEFRTDPGLLPVAQPTIQSGKAFMKWLDS